MFVDCSYYRERYKLKNFYLIGNTKLKNVTTGKGFMGTKQIRDKKRSVKLVIAGILFSFIGLSGSAYAENATSQSEEVVITATKIPLQIKDASSSVSVITREEIECFGANSATDILDMIPGVSVQKTGNFGRADVSIRGFGSRGRRVLIMVDGKPQKMGLYGCTITHALPLDNVERIEVIRGAASTLYGADALGGVVNIITKKATKSCEGDFSFLTGSFDTEVYRLRQGGKSSTMDYYFSADKRRSEGHLPNSHYDHENYTLRLGKKVSDKIDVSFASRYFDALKEEPAPSPVGTWNSYKRGFFDLTIDGDFESFDTVLKAYHNFGDHNFSDGWDSTDYTNGMLLHFNFKPVEGNSFLVGYEYREQGGKVISGGIPGYYDKDENAVFIHDSQRFLDDKIILDAGLRYNDDSYAGDIWLPSLGCVWKAFDNTLIRMSAQKGFRAPHLNELEFFRPSNHDISAEESWNYEIGLNSKLFGKLNFDVVYFIIEAKDFITVDQGRFKNINEVDFNGVESSLEYSFTEKLSSQLAYTYMDLGENTVGRAKQEVNIRLNYKCDKFNIAMSAQHFIDYFAADNGQEKIPPFFLCNMTAEYKITDNISLNFIANNIFNVNHQVYVDLPGSAAGVYRQPGRNFYAGMKYKW